MDSDGKKVAAEKASRMASMKKSLPPGTYALWVISTTPTDYRLFAK
jgi:hypothetical protein